MQLRGDEQKALKPLLAFSVSVETEKWRQWARYRE